MGFARIPPGWINHSQKSQTSLIVATAARADNGGMNHIAIFKTGQHADSHGNVLDATPDYLRAIAASYQPALHEAPAVIGHPADNAPAYGWVQSLAFNDADGVLYANFSQVDEGFAGLLKAGRFKKRSASFYPPGHPANPTPDRPYLRHVGFLGAQPPAVKGLADFADAGDPPGTRKMANAIFREPAPPTYDFDEPEPPQPENPMDKTELEAKEAELAEREKALAAREAELKKREDALAAEEAAREEAEAADFAEGLVKAGKVLPGEKPAVIAILRGIDKGATYDFAEGGKLTQKPAADSLRALLNRLPVAVDFSERTAADPNAAAKPQLPGGSDDDAARAALDAKIQNYAETNRISYAEAAAQITE